MQVLAFGFTPGPLEILLILCVLVLLFGKRLPQVARSMGQSLNMFKKGMKETQDDLIDVMSGEPDEEQSTPGIVEKPNDQPKE